jgi:hypothetical protein
MMQLSHAPGPKSKMHARAVRHFRRPELWTHFGEEGAAFGFVPSARSFEDREKL